MPDQLPVRYADIVDGCITSSKLADNCVLPVTSTITAKELADDYANRLVGCSPTITFESDILADDQLRRGVLLQPYHYPSYKGRFCNRADEIKWLKQLPEERAYLWALTGRDIDLMCTRIKDPALLVQLFMQISAELADRSYTGADKK